jgi:hypothetical protein
MASDCPTKSTHNIKKVTIFGNITALIVNLSRERQSALQRGW